MFFFLSKTAQVSQCYFVLMKTVLCPSRQPQSGREVKESALFPLFSQHKAHYLCQGDYA